MSTEWNINSDIYDIVGSVKDVQKRYIEDEDETTLSLGIFGFIADTESKKIQTSVIMAGQLGNEMFPTRAILTKNILTHAAYNGVADIEATPATITVTICVKADDIDTYINDHNLFFLDATAPIFIGEYEFHFDYDIQVFRKQTATGYTYSAQYIVTDEEGNPITNRLTNITNPYLKQPFLLNIGNEQYVGIQCTIRQFTIEDSYDTMKSDSIVENKTYNFNYSNQLADFQIFVEENGVTTEITPYLYGSAINPTVNNYCWYLYNSDNSVRLVFDSNSYVPGLTANIHIKAFTTLGANGNFNYLNIDDTSEGLYVELTSNNYNYKSIITYLVAVTDSSNGADMKTKTELQKLIPKSASSRGNITTENDINNYFNLINTTTNRLLMKKKVDNQITRTWYGFFLLKDENLNIIPSNTINFTVDIRDNSNVVPCGTNKYLIPAGTVIRYDRESSLGSIISDSQVPSLYSDEYFNDGSVYYYMTIYDTIITKHPIHCSYHLTIFNYDSYFVYDFVNNNSDVQFIANRFHFERNLLTDQGFYNMSFNLAQSIADSSFVPFTEETITVYDEGDNPKQVTITTQNLRVILVLYKNGLAYRWKECTLNPDQSYYDSAIYNFSISLETDNVYDDAGNIKICNMYAPGDTEELYGYLPEDTQASIFILAKTSSIDLDDISSRRGIDDIVPDATEYTVTNVYNSFEAIHFFENYTNITDTHIIPADEAGTMYTIYDVPVIGRQYLMSDREVKFVIDAIIDRKSYIDYCLALVENSVTIDFKFFNTYGPAKTYYLEDRTTLIGNIDVYMRFKLSLKDSSDLTTKDEILADIKANIEDIENIVNWHAPVLISDIISKYEDRINFLEFVGFNTYDADDQHIILVEPEDEDKADVNYIPEFINVRNTIDPDTNELIPMISIELV